MKNTLKQLCDEKQNICIYTSENLSNFFFGRIIAFDKSWILIHHITLGGFDDGLLLKHTDDVTRVDTYGKYTEKMKKLCDLHLTDFNDDKFDIDPANILFSVFKYAEKSSSITTVELLGDSDHPVIGFADDISSDKTCKIKTIDEFGNKDGFSYFDYDDVTEVNVNSSDGKRISDLRKENR